MASRSAQPDSHARAPEPSLQKVTEPSTVAKNYEKAMSQGYRRRMKKKRLPEANTPHTNTTSGDKLKATALESSDAEKIGLPQTVTLQKTPVSSPTNDPDGIALLALRKESLLAHHSIRTATSLLPGTSTTSASQLGEPSTNAFQPTVPDSKLSTQFQMATPFKSRAQVMIGPNGVPMLISCPQLMIPQLPKNPFYHTPVYHSYHHVMNAVPQQTLKTPVDPDNGTIPMVYLVMPQKVDASTSTEDIVDTKPILPQQIDATTSTEDEYFTPTDVSHKTADNRINTPVSHPKVRTAASPKVDNVKKPISVSRHAQASNSMKTAKFVTTNIHTIKYPPGFAPTGNNRHWNYNVEFLLRFREFCVAKPKVDFESIIVRRWQIKTGVNPFLEALRRVTV